MTIEEIFSGESKNVEFKENLSEKTLRNMTALYGYKSLEEAEERQRARLER